MKFSTTVQEFRDAYALTTNTLDRKKATSGAELYIQAIDKDPSRVILFSSDGMALTVVRMNAEVQTAGAALLYFKDMGTSLAALPPTAELTFANSGNRLQMRSQFFRPSCPINADGFSMRQELLNAIPFAKKPVLTISSAKLLDCLERTAAFASHEDQLDQMFLHQVLLISRDGWMEAYATNSKVAAKARIAEEGVTAGFSIEIPVHSVAPLARILNSVANTQVQVIVKNNEATGKPSWLYFRIGAVMFGTALMDGSLPSSVDQIEEKVGETKSSVSLDRKQLLDMLTRCTPFIAARQELALSLAGNVLTVYNDTGEKLDQMEGSGNVCEETCEVTISRDWVYGAVKAMKDASLTLNFSKLSHKFVWMSSGDDTVGRSFFLITTKVEAKKNLAPVTEEKAAA